MSKDRIWRASTIKNVPGRGTSRAVAQVRIGASAVQGSRGRVDPACARPAAYSAAVFIRKPFSIWSDGSTGYSPEKQASQYCGQASLRPSASPTAR